MNLEEYFALVADVDDLEVATDKVMDLIGKDWRTVLHSAVQEVLLIHRRNQVRSIERQAPLTTIFPNSRDGANEVPSLNLLRAELLSKTFSVGGKRPPVLWGEATVADHQARIAYLEKYIVGFKVTIGKHELAVTSIKAKRGAKCLNDLLPKGKEEAA